MNELEVVDQINSLFTPDDLNILEQFEEIKTKVAILTKERNEKLLPILEDYYNQTGESTIRTDRIKITYKKPYTKKQVDTKSLKEQGLYDLFTKEVEVSGSVSVSVNYE